MEVFPLYGDRWEGLIIQILPKVVLSRWWPGAIIRLNSPVIRLTFKILCPQQLFDLVRKYLNWEVRNCNIRYFQCIYWFKYGKILEFKNGNKIHRILQFLSAFFSLVWVHWSGLVTCFYIWYPSMSWKTMLSLTFSLVSPFFYNIPTSLASLFLCMMCISPAHTLESSC